jgi:hypothetical protein
MCRSKGMKMANAKSLHRTANRGHITKVSFRANVTLKQYQTAHIEVEVRVPPNASPDSALEVAQDFVAEKLKEIRDGKEQVVAKTVRNGRFLDRL